ncbi:MAG: hypothetical protein GX575_03500 [Candidatus Anammoximicrobium sp.]|nr:hypothetical protein [Candidatus Anammoximicrobium sp.]
MQTTVDLPQAFSVRDEHEIYPIRHLMARLNPDLRVVHVATGVHVNGGCTVFWGLVYQNGQPLEKADVERALQRAGLDLAHSGPIQIPTQRVAQPDVAACPA